MFLQCFIVLCLAGVCLCQCPDGWSQHNGGCYHYRTDIETWIGAKTVCEYLGGHLVEIHDITLNTFLTGYVAPGVHEAWIGGNDLSIQGSFVWAHSETAFNVTGLFTNWHSGEPNLAHNEDCVEMNHDGTWDSENCSDRQQYICEKDLNSAEVIG